MSALEVFRYEGAEVRTVIVDGEPWFVLADVARILGLTNPTVAAGSVDADDLSSTEVIDALGRTQRANVMNESGLYTLIFQSRKAAARAFKRWVTSEVLPQIRRTGEFRQTEIEHQLPASYADALRELAATVERQSVLEARIAEDAPKVEAYDQLMDADGYYSMESAAKMAGLGRNTFYRLLREAGVIQPGSTLPYQRYMHHFVLTAATWTDRDGNVHPTQTTRVSPSGLPFLLRKLGVLESSGSVFSQT